MSVRNRYASNSTKVSPFPSSSRLAAQSRITSKKLDDMVRSKYMGKKEDYYTKFSRSRSKKQNDITGLAKPSSNNMTDRLVSRTKSDPTESRPKTQILAENGTKQPIIKYETRAEQSRLSSASSDSSGKPPSVPGYLKSNSSKMVDANTKITVDRTKKFIPNSKAAVVRRHSDSRYDTFPERRDKQQLSFVTQNSPLASKQNTNGYNSNLNVPTEKIRRHSDSHCEIRNSGIISEKNQSTAKPKKGRPKSFSDKEDFDVPIFRPKSARPSSRWERRYGDEDSADDDTVDQSFEIKASRPKSARPESRILRHTEQEDDGEHIRQPSPTPRPTTSRGRRRAEDNKDFSDYYLRNISDPDATKSTGTTQLLAKTSHKENVKSLDSKDRHGQSIVYDKSIHGFDPESFRKEQLKVMNAKDVLALNSGIDDIDLDIDPVVYFLQEEDNVTSTTYKPSLSKDVINIIGKANSEEHQPLIGYHGNNLNKQRHKSDGCDNFRNTEQPYLKSTFRENEASSNHMRHDEQKPRNKSKHRAHSYSDSSLQNSWQKTGSFDTMSDKLISKYSAAPSTFADGSKHGFRQERVYQSIFDQHELTVRKPRKLQPLSGRFYPS